MTKVAIIQARMQSKRLPGKVLLPLPTGRTVIEEVIGLVKRIQGVDRVVVAIPETSIDALLIPHIERTNTAWYTGPHTDVLARYWQAAKAVQASVVMRITADCPMLDPSICTAVLDDFLEHQDDERPVDYVSNVMPRTFPKGWDCEVFSWDALDYSHRNATTEYDREHVTAFIHSSWARPNFKVGNVLNDGGEDWSGYNFSLDTLADYYRICVEMENRRSRLARKVIQ